MRSVPQVPPEAKQDNLILNNDVLGTRPADLQYWAYHIKIHSADVCVSPEKLLEPDGSLDALSSNGIVAWFKLGLGLEHGHGMAIYDTFK